VQGGRAAADVHGSDAEKDAQGNPGASSAAALLQHPFRVTQGPLSRIEANEKALECPAQHVFASLLLRRSMTSLE
jgi:hypothetical protein